MQIFNLENSNSIFLNLSKAEGKQTIRVVDGEYVQGWRYYDAVRDADGKFVLDSNGQNKMKMFHVLNSKDIPSVLPPDRYGVQRAKFFLAFKVLHDDRICILVITQRQIANGGVLMKPYIVKDVVAADGTRYTTSPTQIRRVISERSAGMLSGMLVNVVENGHSKAVKTPGYYIAGKTGTAQVVNPSTGTYSSRYNHTFIGFAPANNAKFVILTKLDNPHAVYAESTVVPLARDITRFLLNHWEVKKDRAIESSTKK
jgi:hypothetical protein